MSTELLLFCLCAVLACFPLVVVLVLVGRLHGTATVNLSLGEVGLRKALNERNEAERALQRWEQVYQANGLAEPLAREASALGRTRAQGDSVPPTPDPVTVTPPVTPPVT